MPPRANEQNVPEYENVYINTLCIWILGRSVPLYGCNDLQNISNIIIILYVWMPNRRPVFSGLPYSSYIRTPGTRVLPPVGNCHNMVSVCVQ